MGSFSEHEKTGKGRSISSQWACGNINANGLSTTSQQSSLRKKMKEHKDSEAHALAEKLCKSRHTLESNPLKRKIDECNSHLSETTSRCFLTAYKAAKHARPFVDYEYDIELQQLNGLNMGRILHSDVTCASIVSHIAVEMRKKMLKLCLSSNSKFSVLLDESTSLSKKSCLIVYIRSLLPGYSQPITFFLDLVELQSSTALGIKEALLSCLTRAGFDLEYCNKNWLGITTDGCSTMLGRQNGLVVQLQAQFKNLIPWHCAAHRLELAVADSLKDVTASNSFRVFLEQLYKQYSMSPKNQRELAEVAEALNIELLKIGKVFSIRWVASSYRTVKAVWQNLPALFKHFSNAATDSGRSQSERASFVGLATYLSSLDFLSNLALMLDVLAELSHLSQALQTSDINIQKAHNKILLCKQVFVGMKQRFGKNEREINGATDVFKSIPIKHESRGVQKINRRQFIQSLVDKLDERLFTSIASRNSHDSGERNSYSSLISDLAILDKTTWKAEEMSDPSHADETIERLCKTFCLPSDAVVHSFREYLFSGGKEEMLGSVTHLIQAINTLAIQTAECERGFSAMNRILTPTRASMTTQRLAECLYIYTTGPPLSMFKPNQYVKSWLRQGRHLATDVNAVAKKAKPHNNHQFFDMWKSL